jgi:hypothetical protein
MRTLLASFETSVNPVHNAPVPPPRPLLASDRKQPLLLHGCCECSPELLARRHSKKKDKKRSKYIALDFFEKKNPKKKDKKRSK